MKKLNDDPILEFYINQVQEAIPGISKTVGATKEQYRSFMQVSTSTLDRRIKKRSIDIPKFIKEDGEKGRVYFPLLSIAIFLKNRTTVWALLLCRQTSREEQ